MYSTRAKFLRAAPPDVVLAFSTQSHKLVSESLFNRLLGAPLCEAADIGLRTPVILGVRHIGQTPHRKMCDSPRVCRGAPATPRCTMLFRSMTVTRERCLGSDEAYASASGSRVALGRSRVPIRAPHGFALNTASEDSQAKIQTRNPALVSLYEHVYEHVYVYVYVSAYSSPFPELRRLVAAGRLRHAPILRLPARAIDAERPSWASLRDTVEVAIIRSGGTA